MRESPLRIVSRRDCLAAYAPLLQVITPMTTVLPLLATHNAAPIPVWAWTVFCVVVVGMLALDLGVFHKEEKAVSFREAVAWTMVWAALSGAFGFFIWWLRGPEEAGLFASAYLLEKALSVDNLFVILVIFNFFRIPDSLRHRVLFWGIIGAALMRALFILGGVALVAKFGWLMYVFGAVLIFTGVKMALPENDSEKDLEKNPVVRIAKKVFPITPGLRGKAFFTRENGVRMITPLFLVLLVVEATDVVFAVDSIPAVIGILPADLSQESKNFVAFTSNIFAILGLRSMFFAISGFMKYFRFLKIGLAFILVFIGGKMIAAAYDEHWHIPTSLSLAILMGILAVSVAASVALPEKKERDE